MVQMAQLHLCKHMLVGYKKISNQPTNQLTNQLGSATNQPTWQCNQPTNQPTNQANWQCKQTDHVIQAVQAVQVVKHQVQAKC
jgi:hypothetical protein